MKEPVNERLSARTQEVLGVIRANETWINRSQIAKGLGRKRNRLEMLDFQALAVLETNGKIEVENRPDRRPGGFIAYYRAKQG